MEKIILYILLIFVIITSIFCGEWYRQSKCTTGIYCRYVLNKNILDENGFNKLSCEEIPKKSDVKSITDGMITVMVLTSLIWVGCFFAWVADSLEYFGLITLMYLYILFIGSFSWTFVRNKCYKNKCYPSTTPMNIPESLDNTPEPTTTTEPTPTAEPFNNVYNNSTSILEPFTETTEAPINPEDLRYLHCKTGISKNAKREANALYNSIIVVGIIFSGIMTGLILNVE